MWIVKSGLGLGEGAYLDWVIVRGCGFGTVGNVRGRFGLGGRVGATKRLGDGRGLVWVSSECGRVRGPTETRAEGEVRFELRVEGEKARVVSGLRGRVGYGFGTTEEAGRVEVVL